MKKIFILSLITICSLTRLAVAQTASVNGQIKSSSETLPGATVQLLHLPDSAAVSAQIADANGNFRFTNPKNGSYVVKAVMMGFQNTTSNSFSFTGQSITLPALVLKNSTKALKAVTINGQVPQLEQKSDRLVVNVEKMITTGDNALEVLKKAPGIKLDKDDNILYRNNGGVNIMIDGRMTYMSSSEVSNYLKSLPANAVSKIELIANPPANFDAAGTAGVINIIMKRNRLQGFNGTATATTVYGTYGKVFGGANLNYNTGKLSFYTRANGGHAASYNKLNLGRQIVTDLYSQENYWHPIGDNVSYTSGADYFATAKQTFGFMFRGYNSPQNAKVTSNSVTTNQLGQQIGSVYMLKPQYTNTRTYSFNVNYSYAIDTLGQKLSFDADYVRSSNINNETFSNIYFDAAGTRLGDTVKQRNDNPAKYNIRSLKVDYVWPFAKTWRAETGWKSSWVSTNNNARFENLTAGNWITDLRRSNHFLYDENINAGYLTFNKTVGKKWEFKAGVRAEQTVSTGNSITQQEVVGRNYWKLFPSLFAAYKINIDHQLNASYSGRISRPGYSNLNPFTFFSDPYTAIKGNPYLQPSFSKSWLMSYTYKSFQVLSLSYVRVNNAVSTIISQNDQTKESIATYQNLGNTSSLNATSAGSFNIKKWWNVTANLDASYDKVNTMTQGTPYRSERLSWSAGTDQTFTLLKNFRIQLSGYYYSPSISGLARTLSGSQIDAAINKTFMDKKATLSFKVRDIFFGNRYRSILQYNNVNTTWQNEWESRRFSLGFTYQFGNLKIKTARNRNTGATSEENRM
ncbi:outer membrane beta-barrel family protein [Mucilaginibacter sp. PAMB04168]|uniref:outer membrane beta-barrel family protein n=1 Tax=Mucilaginibacter sp. PAMB04168 TaxID=3138567 RepID=UPI0031F7137E